jgi:ribonuclease HI
MTIREDAINVFTDGSSVSGPRSGGVGIRIVTVDELGREVMEDHLLPGYRGASNNEMELQACITGLSLAAEHTKLPSLRRICVFTDSKYVAENYTNAMFRWPKQQWRTLNGPPVLHVPLWKALVREIRNAACKVEIKWVKGHSKNVHNKAADKLAKASATNPLNPPLSVQRVRRKLTTKSVEIGSVEMRGQTLQIRVINDRYLRKQKLYRYKYEVLSDESKYFGNVDVICSTHMLSAGHHYAVTVNNDKVNPMIVEVLMELDRATPS